MRDYLSILRLIFWTANSNRHQKWEPNTDSHYLFSLYIFPTTSSSGNSLNERNQDYSQSSQSHFSQNGFLTSKSLINNIYYNIYYLLPNFKESQNEFDYFDFDYHDYDAKKSRK